MIIERVYYGWYDTQKREFRISRLPSDAPVRPSLALQTKAEVMAIVEKQRGARIIWWPPLPAIEEPIYAAAE